MAGAKRIVIYPSPRDASAFERAYTQDRALTMVTPQSFEGLKKFVRLPRGRELADGSAAPFARIAELHFRLMANRAVTASRLGSWRRGRPGRDRVPPPPLP